MYAIFQSMNISKPLRIGLVFLVGALVISASLAAAEPATIVPPPAFDEPASSAASETVVLAGGCFWGVQGVFQHVKGVTQAVSGYAGGLSATANYDEVSTGTSGHAESVEITYDPKQISYGSLLQIYFSVVHDPTQLNRQSPDSGPQYRSAIFPRNAMQQKVAIAYIAQLNQANALHAPVVTRVEMGKEFYPAEAYHQNYLALNPTNGYIVFNDLPKVEHLHILFTQRYRAQPVLVTRDSHS